MAFLKNMEKMLSANHKLVLVGLLLLTLAIGMYSNRKSSPPVSEGMQIKNTPRSNPMNSSRLVAPPINRIREGFRQRRVREGLANQAPATGGGGTAAAPAAQRVQSSAAAQSTPGELLPNSQGLFEENKGAPSLLSAGFHQGLDTVGQTLRNANQQLRADPLITKSNTGPWQQSTIEGDSTGLVVTATSNINSPGAAGIP